MHGPLPGNRARRRSWLSGDRSAASARCRRGTLAPSRCKDRVKAPRGIALAHVEGHGPPDGRARRRGAPRDRKAALPRDRSEQGVHLGPARAASAPRPRERDRVALRRRHRRRLPGGRPGDVGRGADQGAAPARRGDRRSRVRDRHAGGGAGPRGGAALPEPDRDLERGRARSARALRGADPGRPRHAGRPHRRSTLERRAVLVRRRPEDPHGGGRHAGGPDPAPPGGEPVRPRPGGRRAAAPAGPGALPGHRRGEPTLARSARRGRAGGAEPGHRAPARRERHRQGGRRAGPPRREPARRAALRRGELRGAPRVAPRERAVRARARRLHRRARRRRRAASSRRTAARSSSTRSASCPCRRR